MVNNVVYDMNWYEKHDVTTWSSILCIESLSVNPYWIETETQNYNSKSMDLLSGNQPILSFLDFN
jgi:hypothetical protein